MLGHSRSNQASYHEDARYKSFLQSGAPDLDSQNQNLQTQLSKLSLWLRLPRYGTHTSQLPLGSQGAAAGGASAAWTNQGTRTAPPAPPSRPVVGTTAPETLLPYTAYGVFVHYASTILFQLLGRNPQTSNKASKIRAANRRGQSPLRTANF